LSPDILIASVVFCQNLFWASIEKKSSRRQISIVFLFHNTLHIDEITEIKPKRKKTQKWFEYKWKMLSVDHIFYKMENFLLHKKIRGGKFVEK
jgi:hypothetical protein